MIHHNVFWQCHCRLWRELGICFIADGSNSTCLGCNERALIKDSLLGTQSTTLCKGNVSIQTSVWIDINILELLFLTEFLTEFQVINTCPGKSHPQLFFSTTATLLVSHFDVSHGNRHNSKYKACLCNATMGTPNLFKHHHFHNSPSKLLPKVSTLRTGLKQNFKRLLVHLQWNTFQVPSIVCNGTARKYYDESLRLLHKFLKIIFKYNIHSIYAPGTYDTFCH